MEFNVPGDSRCQAKGERTRLKRTRVEFESETGNFELSRCQGWSQGPSTNQCGSFPLHKERVHTLRVEFLAVVGIKLHRILSNSLTGFEHLSCHNPMYHQLLASSGSPSRTPLNPQPSIPMTSTQQQAPTQSYRAYATYHIHP